MRSYAASYGGVGGDGIGRGDVGVGAVVDVEQCTLRALKDDFFAGFERFID